MRQRLLLTLLLAGLALGSGAASADPAGPAEPRARAAAESYTPPPAKEGHSYPECYCTGSRGERVEVGQMACLQIGSRQVLSRCEKARNLVIWRHQDEGCPNV